MSTQVCQEHGETVVVYQANVPRLQPCPFCAAELEVQNLGDQVESANSEIDGLQGDIKDFKSTISDLEDQINRLERDGAE